MELSSWSGACRRVVAVQLHRHRAMRGRGTRTQRRGDERGFGQFRGAGAGPLGAACMGFDAIRTLRRQGRSEEHTSELQSLMRISYAVFCLKKKTKMTVQIIDIHQADIHI